MAKKILFGVLALIMGAVLIVQYGSLSLTEEAQGKLFANQSYQAGVTHNRQSFELTIGIAWGDYDNDGWVDLYVTDNEHPNTLYRNNGDGTFSVSPLSDSVALQNAESDGAIFADYDNDGWLDLMVTAWGQNTLFRNDRGKAFVDVTRAAGLADKGENSKSASWGDYDQDGWLDLYIANWACYPRCGRPNTGESDKLYRNNGDGTFTDVTDLLGTKTIGAGFIASFTDFDNDNDLDIYLINDEFINPIGNVLWRNDGPGCDGWCFTEISKDVNANSSLMGMGLATSDYDNDGDFDYYFSNVGATEFLQNQGDGTFVEVAEEIGVDAPFRISFGMIAFDYDNDMWQDLYLAVPAYVGGDDVAANPLFHNNGDGTFSRVESNAGASDVGMTLGVAYADYDQDGWLDMLIGNVDQGYELYQNQAVAAENHWLVFGLEGDGEKINRDAVGTKIIVTTPDGLIQIRELQAGSSVGAGNEMILHFGLGEAKKADITVTWPDGTEQTFENAPADQRITLPYPSNDEMLEAQQSALYANDPAARTRAIVWGAILLLLTMLILYRYLSKHSLLILILALAISGCAPNLDDLLVDADVAFPEELPVYDPETVALGQALFWDPLLGGNRDTACVTCHHPALGTGDGLPLAIGTGTSGLGAAHRQLGEDRQFVPRNATELYNRGYPGWETMFWDNRVFTIEGGHFGSPAAYRLPNGLDNVLAVQAMFPVTSDTEMMGDRGDEDIFGARNEIASIDARFVDEIWDALMLRILDVPEYADWFAEVFPDVPTDELGFEHVANVIAVYEASTFTFTDAPFDRYLQGEKDALSVEAMRGAILFYGKAGCATCHSGLLMTDQKAHNIAVPQFGPGKNVKAPLDFGAMLVTGERDDRFAFRTPPLRNVTLTAPYMHNGAYDNLEDVIWHHIEPVSALRRYRGKSLPNELRATLQNDTEPLDAIIEWLDPVIAESPALTDEDVAYLLAFLEALTSPTAADWEQFVPESVPSGLPVGGAIE